jgi:hypothetical protein
VLSLPVLLLLLLQEAGSYDAVFSNWCILLSLPLLLLLPLPLLLQDAGSYDVVFSNWCCSVTTSCAAAAAAAAARGWFV